MFNRCEQHVDAIYVWIIAYGRVAVGGYFPLALCSGFVN